MAKNIELLSATTPQEVLYPKTTSDMVNVSGTQNLTEKLIEIVEDILKCLPLTGGTVTGVTLFLNGINGGQSWSILKNGVATFQGVNVHRDLVVSGLVSGKRGVGGADSWIIENNGSARFSGTVAGNDFAGGNNTWTLEANGNATFNDMRANGIIYGMNNIALARGTIYLPQGGGNVVADYLRIGGGFMVSADSGNFHFLTRDGVSSNIYCGNVINTYALSSNITKATKSVFDTIDAINVVDTDDGLRLSKATKDIVDSKVISASIINEETQEEGINIDTVGAISTLWKAIQELKQENEELNKRLKLIEEKIAI